MKVVGVDLQHLNLMLKVIDKARKIESLSYRYPDQTIVQGLDNLHYWLRELDTYERFHGCSPGDAA